MPTLHRWSITFVGGNLYPMLLHRKYFEMLSMQQLKMGSFIFWKSKTLMKHSAKKRRFYMMILIFTFPQPC